MLRAGTAIKATFAELSETEFYSLITHSLIHSPPQRAGIWAPSAAQVILDMVQLAMGWLETLGRDAQSAAWKSGDGWKNGRSFCS